MLKHCIYRLNWGRNKSRATDLVKTLQYVSKNRASWKEMWDGLENESEKHVQVLLQLLNSTLPTRQERIVKLQNDATFNQLKLLLKNGITHEPSFARYQDLSQEELYHRLIMLHLTNKLNASEILKIFINGKFNQWDKICDTLILFKPQERIFVSLIIYYKTHNTDIWNEYYNMWLNNYPNLPDSYKRIFWRCIYSHYGGKDTAKIVWDTMVRTQADTTHSEWILLYQSLFHVAQQLPVYFHLLDHENSKLFIESLRVLSLNNIKLLNEFSSKIVKLSIQTKLSLQSNEATDKILEYKFITSLHSILHDAYVEIKSLKVSTNNDNDDSNISDQARKILKLIQRIDKDIESLQISII